MPRLSAANNLTYSALLPPARGSGVIDSGQRYDKFFCPSFFRGRCVLLHAITIDTRTNTSNSTKLNNLGLGPPIPLPFNRYPAITMTHHHHANDSRSAGQHKPLLLDAAHISTNFLSPPMSIIIMWSWYFLSTIIANVRCGWYYDRILVVGRQGTISELSSLTHDHSRRCPMMI